MNIKMDLSEILLWLDLIKKHRQTILISELKMMLYNLENYDQVKQFINKLDELEFNPPFKFFVYSLIHFIEDYDECVKIKNKVFQLTKRKYSILFIHQILLCKTQEQALNIMNEAKRYDIEIGEVWATRYDSMWRIKNDQEAWKENLQFTKDYNDFSAIYEKFSKMKLEYFKGIPLKQLKQDLLEQQSKAKVNRGGIQTSIYNRNVFIKEFARKVANGICQLCENKAPFLDKHGQPFLEVHHIHYLSKGGNDSIDNVIALCPNCHRKIHQLELEEDAKKVKEKALANLIV
ncbi:HNH endonuclease [Cytobacillus sp. SAFR-174]|uniref:HNH endonuclease n=1 Tax=Cytobacillus sp. SAFR-174 TaxID=3436868 RepID=UPI003F7DD4AC